jgi:hypothetical protein
MRAYWRSWDIATRILDLGTGWRWVVSFTLRPLYLKRKRPWYPLDGRLGGTQSRSGWRREKFPAPAGNRTPDHPARSPALYHWATPAKWTVIANPKCFPYLRERIRIRSIRKVSSALGCNHKLEAATTDITRQIKNAYSVPQLVNLHMNDELLIFPTARRDRTEWN